jgi:hypothetical protein
MPPEHRAPSREPSALSLSAKTGSAVPHPSDGWCERDSGRCRSAPFVHIDCVSRRADRKET